MLYTFLEYCNRCIYCNRYFVFTQNWYLIKFLNRPQSDFMLSKLINYELLGFSITTQQTFGFYSCLYDVPELTNKRRCFVYSHLTRASVVQTVWVPCVNEISAIFSYSLTACG